jgi:peptidylglycine monooxygenase
MSRCIYLTLAFLGLLALVNCEPKKIEMLMPNVSPQEKDTYLCFQMELNPEESVYITKYVPKSTKAVAHHILINACEMPGSREEVWQCGEMNVASPGKQQYQTGPICRGEQNIIYAWAMDAPELVLPKDVAFKLGAGTKKKFVVMQVHYANVDKFLAGGTDASGVILVGQTEMVPYLAGVYLTVTGGYVQANSEEHFEAACEMKEDVEMIPFAYRTHTHKLGKVNSGYIVRNDPIIGDAEQTWIEIGRRSPQLPQMFYPISNNMTIRKGDTIASRCTIDNTQDHRVYVGSTGNDEMCNFYIMYYTRENSVKNSVCFTNGPPSWYFKDFMDSKGNKLQQSKIPIDIGNVPAEQIEMLKTHDHSKHHGQNAMTHETHNFDHQSTVMSNEESELNDLLSDSDYEKAMNRQKMIALLKELLVSRYDE